MLRLYLTVFCCLFLIGCSPSASPQPSNNPSPLPGALTAEIRGNEDGDIYFCKGCSNNFHFILHAEEKDAAVFESTNSWGFWNRSFTLTDKKYPKSKYLIYRSHDIAWTANAPKTVKIKAGDFLINDINFCDGEWVIKPKLSPGNDYYFSLQGHFDEEDMDKSEPKESRDFAGPFWIGHLDTNVVDFSIERNVVDVINKVKE